MVPFPPLRGGGNIQRFLVRAGSSKGRPIAGVACRSSARYPCVYDFRPIARVRRVVTRRQLHGGRGLLARRFVTLSVASYILSLILTPWGSWPGWADLVFGWLGIPAIPVSLTVLSSLCWLANPMLLAAWITIKSGGSKRTATAWAFASLATAGSFMLMETALSGDSASYIGPLKIGYWVWLASIACACAGAFALETNRAPQTSGSRPAHRVRFRRGVHTGPPLSL